MKHTTQSTATSGGAARLRELYRGCGWMQSMPQKRLRKLLGEAYKRGYEIRFAVRTRAELNELRRLLKQLHFKPGKPFPKGSQIIQPLYGKEAMKRFMALRSARGVARKRR